MNLHRLIVALATLVAGILLISCSGTMRQRQEFFPGKQPKEMWSEAKDSTGNYVRQGRCMSWHENGQEKTAGEYHNGLKAGAWTTKDAQGRLVEWCEYENSELHGLSVSYYPNKNKRQEGKYVHGKREGVWRQWFENGSLKEDGAYINNRQHCIWTS